MQVSVNCKSMQHIIMVKYIIHIQSFFYNVTSFLSNFMLFASKVPLIADQSFFKSKIGINYNIAEISVVID